MSSADTKKRPGTSDEEANKRRGAVQIEDLVVFGPRMQPTSVVLQSAKDEFNAGLERRFRWTREGDPLRSVQVLFHAAGRLVDAPTLDPASADISTFPVGPTLSMQRGATLLYNIIRLVETNTPSGVVMADMLWRHYRLLANAYLGDVAPRLYTDIMRLDNRFTEYAWVVATMDARSATTDDDLEVLRQFSGTPHWDKWISMTTPVNVRTVATNVEPIGEWKPIREKLREKAGNVNVGTVDKRLLKKALLMAGSAPVDPFSGRDVDPVVRGAKPGAPSEMAFDHILRAYRAAAGNNMGAHLHVFLFVWLPLRTGIGFDARVRKFSARIIATHLVGDRGLLPLFGSALYATPPAIGGNPSVYSLANELLRYWGFEGDTYLREFLLNVRPVHTTRWATASSVAPPDAPNLDALFRAVLAYKGAGMAVTRDRTPWLARVMDGDVTWAVVPVGVRFAERTTAAALGLYATAADRIGAPDADGVRYGELAAPQANDVVEVLVTNRSVLLILVGPALGRLALTLAYRHENLAVVCVPVRSHESSDWVTPIRDEMNRLGAGVGERVVMLHDLPMAEWHTQAGKWVDAARAHGLVRSEFVVLFNHYNAALEVDVSMPLFGRQAEHVVAALRPVPGFGGLIATCPVGANNIASPVVLVPAALRAVFERRQIMDRYIYTERTRRGVVPTMRSLPTADVDRRRRALMRTLAPGGPLNPLFAAIRDALYDAADALAFFRTTGERDPLLRQALRTTVLVQAMVRLRRAGMMSNPVPEDVLQWLSWFVRELTAAQDDAVRQVAAALNVHWAELNQAAGGPGDRLLVNLLRQAESQTAAAQVDLFPLPRVRINAIDGSIRSTDIPATIVASLAARPDCVQAVTEWATAVGELVAHGLADYKDNFYKWSRNRDRNDQLDLAADAVERAWPPMVACLASLAEEARGKVTGGRSVPTALGPALVYAQMIADTLHVAQLQMQSLHTDFGSDGYVAFETQETPFLAWAMLRGGGTQAAAARLADMLFHRRSWTFPITTASAQESEAEVGMSLREVSSTAAQSIYELVVPDSYKKDYLKWREARLDKAKEEVDVNAKKLSAQASASKISDERQQAEEELKRIKESMEPASSVAEAFIGVGQSFRVQSRSVAAPLLFFIPEAPQFTAEWEHYDRMLVEAINQETAAFSPSDGDGAPEAWQQMMSFLEALMYELSFAYIGGGFDAVATALAGRESKRAVAAELQGDALNTRAVWRLDLSLDPDGAYFDDAFGAQRAPRARAWLKNEQPNNAFPLGDWLLLTRDTVRDETTGAVDELSRELVLIPEDGALIPSDEQAAWLKRYLLALDLDRLQRKIADYETLKDGSAIAVPFVQQKKLLDEADAATLAKLDSWYGALVARRELRDTAAVVRQLDALANQATEEQLLRSLPTDNDGQASDNIPDEMQPNLDKKLTVEGAVKKLKKQDPSVTESYARILERFYRTMLYWAPRDFDSPWRRFALVDVPSYEQLTAPAVSFSMDPYWLRKAIGTSALPGAPAKVRPAGKELKGRLLEALTGSQRKPLLKIKQIINTFVNASDEQKRKWWDKAVERRNRSNKLYRRDLLPLGNWQLVDRWVNATLDAGVPAKVDVKQFGNLRAFYYLTKASTAETFRMALEREINRLVSVGAADIEATSDDGAGLLAVGGTVQGSNPLSRQYTLPPFATALGTRAAQETFDSYYAERVGVAAIQRSVWTNALGRLVDLLNSRSVASATVEFLRTRSASWAQRVRRMDPARADDAAWPAVLSAINERLPPGDELTMRGRETVARAVEEVERAFTAYTDPESGPAQTLRRADLALALVRTATQNVTGALDDTTMMIAYANAIGGQVSSQVRLLRMKQQVFGTAEQLKRREETRTKAADGPADGKLQSTDDDSQDDVKLLELYSERFVDPVARLDTPFVMNSDDVAELSGRLDPDDAQDDLLAAACGSLTQYLAFWDAERNNGAVRVNAGDSSLQRFYAAVTSKAVSRDSVRQALVDHLLANQLLYGDLHSISVADVQQMKF